MSLSTTDVDFHIFERQTKKQMTVPQRVENDHFVSIRCIVWVSPLFCDAWTLGSWTQYICILGVTDQLSCALWDVEHGSIALDSEVLPLSSCPCDKTRVVVMERKKA